MKQFASTNSYRFSRRDFLKITAKLGLSAAGMTLLEACGVSPTPTNAEANELETRTIRIGYYPVICLAPLIMAEDLLKAEGFTNVQFVDPNTTFDFCMQFSGPSLVTNAGNGTTMLAGVDTGCWEVFGNDKVTKITDLKGKSIVVSSLGQIEHIYFSLVLAYVGLDPNKDVNFVIQPDSAEAAKQFADGKVDAIFAWPPFSQEMHARQIGHTVVDSMVDMPWSQYFCSMLTSFGGFAQKYPVATKRVVRAVLKAADICDREKERTAQAMVDIGITPNYDWALEAIQMIPFNHWRDYDPEDTLRFYALRLRDVGLIKGNVNESIQQAADWHFLNEVKAEWKE